MFLLDSLMISGIQWALKTVISAAEAEMNDDSALRDRLLEAEMQREMGEISDEEFAELEADLLQAIREIKQRREGGSGAFAFGPSQPLEAGEDARFQIEAEVSGDFYGAPETAAQTEVITVTPEAVEDVVMSAPEPPRPSRPRRAPARRASVKSARRVSVQSPSRRRK